MAIGFGDDFERADATLSSPWVPRGTSTMLYDIVSGKIDKTIDGDYVACYSGSVVTDDQWSRIAANPTGGNDFGPVVRAQGTTTPTFNAYMVDNGDIGKWVNGAFTAIVSSVFTPPTADQNFAISARGSTISALVDNRWRAFTTDTSVPTGGLPGMFIFAAADAVKITNWRGGDLNTVSPDASPPSVPTRSDSNTFVSTFESSSTASDNVAILPDGIPAGRLVIVTGMHSTLGTVTSVSDSAGNTYSIVAQRQSSATGSPWGSYLAWSLLTKDITPGDYLRVTYSSGINRAVAHLVATYTVPVGTLTLDGHSEGFDDTFPQSSPANSGSATALVANTLAIGATFDPGVISLPSSWTPTSGFTQSINVNAGSSIEAYLEDGLFSPGSVASTPTPDTNQYWDSYLALFSVLTSTPSLGQPISRPRGMPRKVNDEAPFLYRPWIR